ncbi:MAG: methionyl-tRNA formyltransferase [Hyphomicrobiaceae bacterium]
MRIVVHGQQAFGKAVLERLLERGETVVAVCCAPTREGRPADPLAELARQRGLPLHQPSSWKTPEALALMRSFEADICLMAYVLLFVPQAVLDAPRLGTFQYHPSLLPHHRGPSSINWPIAQGKTRTGLSIFWPDDGLDEGPILLQKSCEIGPDETLGDVYFNKLFPMGVDAMIEALELVKAGIILKHRQDLATGSYESWFKRDIARIVWDRPVVDIYNLVRASNPAPGAWTTLAGAEFDIFECALTSPLEASHRAASPGEILAIDGAGIEVAAGGGSIIIKRVRPADAKKMPATEFAAAIGLKRGDVLGV